MTDLKAMRLAWERRRIDNLHRVLPDNASLPAGSPMFFRCSSCFGDIILAEGFLTVPSCCYDCLDLSAEESKSAFVWPTHCFACGVVLMGGATKHTKACKIGQLIREVLP